MKLRFNIKLKKLEIVALSYLLFLVLCIISQNKLLIIISLIVFDKALLSQLRIQSYFGIELISVPMIFIGLTQGPWFAFLFGTFALPILDILRWILAPPIHPTQPPVIPNVGSILYGSMAALAFFMYPSSDLIVIVLATSIIGDSLYTVGMLFLGHPQNPISHVINVIQNYFIMQVFILAGFTKFIGLG